jgi:hypothetical protein
VITEPVGLPEGSFPCLVIELFKDPKGNYFASVTEGPPACQRAWATGTYTDAREALNVAIEGARKQ